MRLSPFRMFAHMLACVWIMLLGVSQVSAQPDATPVDAPQLVTPSTITIVDGVCAEGVFHMGTVAVDDDTEVDGITYVVTQPDADGSYAIRATVQPGHAFDTLENTGWIVSPENPGEAHFEGQFTHVDCAAGPEQPATPGSTPNEDASERVMPGVATPSGESTPTGSPEANARLADISALAVGQTQGCGSAPYPDPTASGSQLPTSSITTSNVLLTHNGVTVGDGGTINLDGPYDQLSLSLNWAVNPGVDPQPDDYFVYPAPLDSNGNPAFSAAHQYFEIRDGDLVIACASVIDGGLFIKFTDYVTTHDNVAGTAGVQLSMYETESTIDTVVEVTFEDGSTVTIGVPANEGDGEPDREFWKGGWFNGSDQGMSNPDNAITFEVKLPAQTPGLQNVNITDASGTADNWSFSCDAWGTGGTFYTIRTNPRDVTIPITSESCSGDSVNLVIASVPDNVEVFVHFRADVETLDDGTSMPGPFENTVHVTADNHELMTGTTSVVRSSGSGEGSGDARPGQLTITKVPNVTVVTDVDQEIIYTFTVTNTGPVTVNGIQVVDEKLALLRIEVQCPSTSLAAGASMECTSGAYVVTQADIDGRVPILNTAYAEGENPATTPVPTPSTTATVVIEVTPSPVPPTPTTPSPVPSVPATTPSPSPSTTPTTPAQPTNPPLTPTVDATVTPSPSAPSSPTATPTGTMTVPSPTPSAPTSTSTVTPGPTNPPVSGLPSTGGNPQTGSVNWGVVAGTMLGATLMAVGLYRKRMS